MAKTQETASVDCGDELQKIYKVQPRLSRLHLSIILYILILITCARNNLCKYKKNKKKPLTAN